MADSSLVEYMMGRNVCFHIGNDKFEIERKVMATDHQVNRRGQVQAVVKVIETAGNDLGDEYKFGVSGVKHSTRGAIKDDYAQAHTLEQLAKAAGMKELGRVNNKIEWKQNTKNSAANLAGAAKYIIDHIAGGGSPV